MNKRKWTAIPFVVVLFFSSVFCSLCPRIPGAQNTPTPDWQGTISALQSTIDVLDAQTKTPYASAGTGSISGNLSFPGESIPPLRIVAFRVQDGKATGEYDQVVTAQDTALFQISGLTPGQYWIVAYLVKNTGSAPGLAGGYTQAVLCGLSVVCKDHSLILVDVRPGLDVQEIDPGDWYAPRGSFPIEPAK
jgi:hypothetical protein